MRNESFEEIYAGEEQNPLAPSPSVQIVMLQYPTTQDAVTAVSVGSNAQPLLNHRHSYAEITA